MFLSQMSNLNSITVHSSHLAATNGRKNNRPSTEFYLLSNLYDSWSYKWIKFWETVVRSQKRERIHFSRLS